MFSPNRPPRTLPLCSPSGVFSVATRLRAMRPWRGWSPFMSMRASCNRWAMSTEREGGAPREVFLVPTQFMAKTVDGRLGISPIRRAYIIRNGRVAPEYKAVKARTLSIAGRAVSSLIKSQGVGDLYELYVFAKKNGMDYNLAYIPGDFHDNSTQAFDPVYMTKLYDLRFPMAQAGYPGKKVPPT